MLHGCGDLRSNNSSSSRRLRIFFAYERLLDPYEGANGVSVQTLQLLEHLIAEGHEVTVYSPETDRGPVAVRQFPKGVRHVQAAEMLLNGIQSLPLPNPILERSLMTGYRSGCNSKSVDDDVNNEGIAFDVLVLEGSCLTTVTCMFWGWWYRIPTLVVHHTNVVRYFETAINIGPWEEALWIFVYRMIFGLYWVVSQLWPRVIGEWIVRGLVVRGIHMVLGAARWLVWSVLGGKPPSVFTTIDQACRVCEDRVWRWLRLEPWKQYHVMRSEAPDLRRDFAKLWLHGPFSNSSDYEVFCAGVDAKLFCCESNGSFSNSSTATEEENAVAVVRSPTSVVSDEGKKTVKLLYVGRVCSEKCVDELWELMEMLRSEERAFHFELTVIGKQEFDYQIPKSALKHCAVREIHRISDTSSIQQPLPLPSRDHIVDIHLLGEIKDRRALAAMYQAHDFFVFPSDFDTFGAVVVEAMLCGCLPLVRNACGPGVIVEDGVSGYTWDHVEEVASILLTFADDPTKCTVDRERVRLRGRSFTAEASYEQFRAIVARITSATAGNQTPQKKF